VNSRVTAASREPVTAGQLTIVPANEASWADIQAVFGQADYPGRCYCQGYKTYEWPWNLTTEERRGRMLRQARCGDPDAEATTGLVAYLCDEAGDREPVGHVAVEPRVAYPRLRKKRTVWAGRDEDKEDPGVWSVTCFTVRKGYRGRGITYHLAAATVGYARDRGAAALEAYPMVVPPGKEITWGELHVGSVQVFEEAGFTEVARPSPRRVVMRVAFTGGG
jgi:GNAT superfamily N-acetyltransferase